LNERFERLLSEAEQYIHDGKLNSAHLALRKVIKKSPQLPDALIVQSQLEFAELKFDQANKTLCEALNNVTNQYSILDKLLIQFEKRELHFKKIEVLKKLIILKPGDSDLSYQYALALIKVGNVEEAINQLKKCINGESEDPFILLNLGHAYKANGNFETAAEYYNIFINKAPTSAGYGYWSLADLKNYKFTTTQLSDLKNKIEETASPSDTKNQGLLQLALGNYYDKQKEYLEAFQLISQGNNNIGGRRSFNEIGYTTLVKDILKYNPTSAEVPLPDPLSDNVMKPIFIVGMPRSGTTLVEQILSSHSDVVATDELPYIERIAIQLSAKGHYTNNLINMSEATRHYFSDSYIEQALEYADTPSVYFIDKNPTNFLHIGLIFKIFPHAKVINLIRNPLDNAFSVYKQHFSQGNDFSYHLGDITCYMQGYYDLMNHFTSCFRERIYHQNYQELVSEPEINIKNLLEYCDLKFQEPCLNFHLSDRPVLTPSASQVRQPMSKNSINTSEPFRELMEPYATIMSGLAITYKPLS
jgi:tetratricopeptide (TPR) repeat protein